MNCLHSTVQWLPFGEHWLHTQIVSLPRRVRPHIVCERRQNEALFPSPPIHSLRTDHPGRYYLERGMRRLGLVRALPFVAETAVRIGADLLHSHFAAHAWANGEAAREAGVPHVVSVYGSQMDVLAATLPHWAKRFSDLAASADLILCEGPDAVRRVVARGAAPERVAVHHLGVDLDRYRYQPRIRARGEPLRVLLAGSFVERTGLPDALAALGAIRRDVCLEITLIGDALQTTESQAELARIDEAIWAAGLEHRVRRLGAQSRERIHEESGRHHVFLAAACQSRDGDSGAGLPHLLTELAATGMPVITTQLGDRPELFRHGQTGLLAPEGDVDTLAAHLLWTVRRPDAWRAMLDAARLLVEREYDMQRQGERLAAHYASVWASEDTEVAWPEAA
ncbi:MAG: glycosyltransferase [Alphaproteobacteria bacterium]